MRPVRVALGPNASVTLGGSHLVMAAALLGAAVVLLAYLQVLHGAVERGALARVQQVAAAPARSSAQIVNTAAAAPLAIGRAQLGR